MRLRYKWTVVVGGVLLRLLPEFIELLAFGGDPHLPSPHRTVTLTKHDQQLD